MARNCKDGMCGAWDCGKCFPYSEAEIEYQEAKEEAQLDRMDREREQESEEG